MPENYILKKEHLKSFLRKLQKDYRLVAPVKNKHGDTLFSVVDSLDTANIDLENQAQASVKSYLFPQQESLFTYTLDKAGTQYEFKEDNHSEPTVFFGLRSCDLSAILYMDVVFLGKNKDPYYLKKREKTILISLGCNDPFANCFCRSTRSGPFLEFGFDLQFTDLDDRFFIEPGRAKGEDLIRQWRQFFVPATEEDEKARYQATLEAHGKFKQQVLTDLTIQRLKENRVPEHIWHTLSARCQDCAGCAYICPTCVCYNMTDRKISENQGERLRTWDACTFAGFTAMAGGHNPTDMDKYRIRRRFMHKLHFDVKQHGRPSCVGCGRCVDMCFGGVDIIKFINMVNSEE
jgi:ferredoxin